MGAKRAHEIRLHIFAEAIGDAAVLQYLAIVEIDGVDVWAAGMFNTADQVLSRGRAFLQELGHPEAPIVRHDLSGRING